MLKELLVRGSDITGYNRIDEFENQSSPLKQILQEKEKTKSFDTHVTYRVILIFQH